MVIFQQDNVIPLLGLTQGPHFVVLILIAIGGSLLAIFLFPRIFCPLFLKIKNLLRKNYKDAYIDIEALVFSKRNLLRRFTYIFLLELGLLALIISIIPEDFYSIFLTEAYGLDYYVGELGIPAPYITSVIGSLVLLIIPIVNGLWSVAWILEDAGLMHYNFNEENESSLFEIEPIHRNYSYYLKGYAGISSIIFLIQVILAWIGVTTTTGENRITDIISTLFIPVMAIIVSLPSYFIYGKFSNKKFLIKEDLQKIRKLKESDVLANKV